MIVRGHFRFGRSARVERRAQLAVEHDRASDRARRGSRAVSHGSSASTVPIPTSTASCVSRRRWTSARAASPVIHFDSPLTVAILPSSVIAALSVNAGRPCVAHVKNGRFARVALVDEHAALTAILRAAQRLDAAAVAGDRILACRPRRARRPTSTHEPAHTAACGRDACTARG